MGTRCAEWRLSSWADALCYYGGGGRVIVLRPHGVQLGSGGWCVVVWVGGSGVGELHASTADSLELHASTADSRELHASTADL